MNPIETFQQEVREEIEEMAQDTALKESSLDWMIKATKQRYSYHFTWMGRPIIQYPQDIMAMQEIIWKVKPDLIIETGIAHGGSLAFYASMLELLGSPDAKVIGIDIDIRAHNRVEIEKHPLFKRMVLVEGSSLAEDVVRQVHELAQGYKRVLCVLDSCHTDAHVWQELSLYADLVSKESYLVVCDTVVEDLPNEFFADRPWKQGDNPRTALRRFLAANDHFETDTEYQNKLQLSVCPDGYLKRVK